MLKRLVRHRIFLTFIALAILFGGIAAPVRHDYTYDQYPGACDKDCGYGQQTTEVKYGVPFTWLTLAKTTSVYDKHVVKQTRTQEPKDLVIDLVACGVVMGIVLTIVRMSRKDENFRD